jgi:hypothetical protein
MEVANTLAYYDTATITGVSVKVETPGRTILSFPHLRVDPCDFIVHAREW